MRARIYARLAKDNIFKNKKIYLPFIFSVILSTFMIYIIHFLATDSSIRDTLGGADLQSILNFGVWTICIFVAIFLFYTNSFIVKRRKKEFGLYGVLGMEKRHVSIVVFMEQTFVLIISLVIGLLLSVLFSKIFYLLTLKIIGAEVSLGFKISFESMAFSAIYIGIIFILMFLNSLRFVHLSNPIELLNADKVGEKEPKAKIILSLIGLLFLGAGYYISITTKSPMAALGLFFVAVILVILGTYILFTTGSISLLKGLKRNKSYYYKAEHFISISSMIYRMKQNAVGLANIAILSTMVLVMLSTTISMWVGVDDLIVTRYPRELILKLANNDEKKEDARQIINQNILKSGVKVSDSLEYKLLDFPVIYEGEDENKLVPVNYDGTFNIKFSLINLVSLEDYNKATGSNEKLNEDEIFLYNAKDPFDHDNIVIADKKFKVKKIEDMKFPDLLANIVFDSKIIIVKDDEIFNSLAQQIEKDMGGKNFSNIYIMMFNTDKSKSLNVDLYKDINSDLASSIDDFILESRSDSIHSFKSLYGGLFFIGIFLSLIFLVATIIIIYYKQISEGLEDKSRFEIMKHVGLDKDMIKKSINSQVLIVFFLPLLVAFVHLSFAFPIIKRLLRLLMLTNVMLYVKSMIIICLVFSLVYFIIYKITSKTYYNIVKE